MMRNCVVFLMCVAAIALATVLSACSGGGVNLDTDTAKKGSAGGSLALYMNEDSSGNLVLSEQAPSGDVGVIRDSGPLTRSGGNQWREVGLWTTELPEGVLAGEVLATSAFWLADHDPSDEDRAYDFKTEIYVNGEPAGGRLYFRPRRGWRNYNPLRQIDYFVLDARDILADGFIGAGRRGSSVGGDALSLKLSVRMGTDGDGNPADAYSTSGGVACHFGSDDCPSSLMLTELAGTPLYLNETSTGELTLEDAAPLNAVPAHRESGPLTRDGGNPWVELGDVMGGKGMNMEDFLITRSILYLESSNISQDVDKSYDIKVETFVNGLPAGEGILYGTKKKPGHVITVIGGFRSAVPEGDISMSISIRMGTDGNGNPIPGSGNSAGLTCFFGSVDCPSVLELIGE